MESGVTFNAALKRYELTEDGHTAFALCHREGDTFFIDYVEAPPPLRGTGAAGRLMEGMMTQLRAEDGIKVVPVCGYAASWLKRHPV